MARFGDNPILTSPPANLQIPAENPATEDDVCVTPDILTQFAQDNMPLAGGSETRGLISGDNADKLTALYTKAELDAIFTQFAQFPFPIFIANPVDGFIEVYRNVLDNDVEFDFMWFQMTAGTSLLTVKIDGVPVTGWESVLLSNVSTGAIATAAKTLPSGSVLGLEFASTGGAENLRLTLKGSLTLA